MLDSTSKQNVNEEAMLPLFGHTPELDGDMPAHQALQL